MTTGKYNLNPLQLASAILLIAAFLVYAVYLVQAIYVERALFADGAFFFVALLSNENHWPIVDDSKHIRLFVNTINQFPIALALKSGITSLRTLKVLFGAGLFLTPLLSYF